MYKAIAGLLTAGMFIVGCGDDEGFTTQDASAIFTGVSSAMSNVITANGYLGTINGTYYGWGCKASVVVRGNR